MSFLRRLRRDKEDPAPTEEAKSAPKDEVKDDDVRVYGAEELPAPPRRSKAAVPAEAPAATRVPSPRDSAPAPESERLAPAQAAPVEEPIPTTTLESPPAPTAMPPPPAPDPPSIILPPPLPERGPPIPPPTVRPPFASGSCFVCGTPLEGKHCSLCRMTWVE
jgi:hypothetical protein